MLGEANATQKPDRRAVRRAATQAEILDAAWEMVREQGLAALSLRDLAERVGMRAPSLYQYFDSKNAIYDAMFKQGAEAALATRANLVADLDDTPTLLKKMAHLFFDFATSDPARSQLLFQRTIPGFEPSPESYAPAIAFLHQLHEVFEARGITDPDAADTWTALLSGLINQQIANDPGGTRWARLIDRSVDMFIAEYVTGANPKKGKR
jgi:AcrR family transcriptional regulator